jgi:glycosyltransferase involved in cell wall biosynthesis
MRILFALTYYRPHLSGLTIFAQSLAESLAARGHELTVIASRHDERLAAEETLDGVRVVRVPVSARVGGKGVLMTGYARAAGALLPSQDVVVVNLPASPSESVVLPALARLRSRAPALVAVYYCDLHLPGGALARALGGAAFACNASACALAARVVTLTEDYAEHSPLLRLFRRKREVIEPAVRIEAPTAEGAREFRRRHAPGGERVVGVAARVAAEKGIEHLLEALPRVRAGVGEVKILFTGEPGGAVGEQAYWERLRPLLARAGASCVFVGTLARRELPDFYAACDVTVLPSTNSTEAFGLVQLESMLSGTPVVASDLPGVRVPVRETGMGRVVPPRSPDALADAIVEVIRNRAAYVRPREEIERRFSFGRMAGEYESLFERLARGRRG